MDNKTVYALVTLLCNSIGVPCFLQGKTKAGILRIVLALVSLGIVGIINAVKGIILSVKIFQMSEEEFQATKGTLLSGIPSGLK